MERGGTVTAAVARRGALNLVGDVVDKVGRISLCDGNLGQSVGCVVGVADRRGAGQAIQYVVAVRLAIFGAKLSGCVARVGQTQEWLVCAKAVTGTCQPVGCIIATGSHSAVRIGLGGEVGVRIVRVCRHVT